MPDAHVSRSVPDSMASLLSSLIGDDRSHGDPPLRYDRARLTPLLAAEKRYDKARYERKRAVGLELELTHFG